MATFLEDPRLRQRWTRTLHATETATENAAAGIWSIQHNYIGPCLGSVLESLESCAAPCLGDREERAARRRQRERGRAYGFDFYDDWDDEDEALVGGNWGGASASGSGAVGGGGGSGSTSRGWGSLLGSWGAARGEDWDRLIGGSGAVEGVEAQQPRRKRGMSYGTATQPGTAGGERRGSSSGRKVRKHAGEERDDPTIIPSTAPLGFLGRLPFKIGGTLRYKPSAANLREHVGGGERRLEDEGERQPLLSLDGEDDDVALEGRSYYQHHTGERHPGDATGRKRSGTTGSGDTSDSFRSRNDLFPSDEEADGDAVELDDEFAVALGSVILPAPSVADSADANSNRRSNKRKKKRKGSEGEPGELSRSVSRTTIASNVSGVSTYSFHPAGPEGLASPRSASNNSLVSLPAMADAQRDRQLRDEDAEAAREEHDALERRREAAARLAAERGLVLEQGDEVTQEVKTPEDGDVPGAHELPMEERTHHPGLDGQDLDRDSIPTDSIPPPQQTASGGEDFTPARLPSFTAPVNSRPPPGQAARSRDDFVPARLPHFR